MVEKRFHFLIPVISLLLCLCTNHAKCNSAAGKSFDTLPILHNGGCSVYISLTLSVDGRMMAWGLGRALYLAETQKFPSYRRYCCDSFPFVTQMLKLSGNGKILYGIGTDFSKHGFLYRGIIEKGRLMPQNYLGSYNFSRDYLRVNDNGDRLLTAIEDPDRKYSPGWRGGDRLHTTTQGPDSHKCSPGWRAAVAVSYEKGNYKVFPPLTPQTSCTFVRDLFLDEWGTVYYSYQLSGQTSDEELFIAPPGTRKQVQLPSGLRIIDIAKTGERILFSGKVSDKDRKGDSLITLFVSEMVNDSLSTPVPILLPHVDPICWGARFTPNATNIVWTNLVRANNGDSIIRTEIQMSRLLNGKWSVPETLCEVPNIQVQQLVASNNNIALTNIRNDVIFYPSISSGKSLILLNVSEKPCPCSF